MKTLLKKIRLMKLLWQWHHNSCFTMFVQPETHARNLWIVDGVMEVGERGHLVGARFIGGPLLDVVVRQHINE